MIASKEAQNYLGIDWGKRDIGISIAHAETRIAIPFMTERNDNEFLERLGRLVAEEAVGTIVIGIPSHVNRVVVEYPGEKLGKQLTQQLAVRIAYQDEMFTTKLAHQRMIERGEKHISQHDDAEAACIILQQWLDRTAASPRHGG